jgi:hypothetical protein
MPLPFEILQVTAAYSNAVLLAIMPHVADFAKKLELPISQPVNASQVAYFRCSPRSDHVGGRLVLTNGYEFVFDNGGIRSYESPLSYYSLQDPNLIPKLFGPVKLTEELAVRIAHNAIKKLGYTDEMLSAGSPPQITPPPLVRKNYVPRYRIRWLDPTRGGGGPGNLPTSAEFEVDATTGQIQMLKILSPNTWQDDPKVDIHPPAIGKSPETIYRGGRKMYPVSQAFSNAFLTAIISQCNAYVQSGDFQPKFLVTASEVNKSSYICSLVDNDPMASFNLKNGAHFDYRHGQVIGFYAPDVMELPGREWPYPIQERERFQKKFYGPINMTTNEVVVLVRKTIQKLGYSETTLHVDEPPSMWGPSWWGTNQIARCTVQWHEPNEGAIQVQAEVDLTTKTVKSLYINDHANTKIWRSPPDIGIPLQSVPSPSPSPTSEESKPPVSLPPGMPLPVH